ncbi:ribulose-phosphate 3-epimerase [Tetragenococcus koreensis]|nr:ribulose-phosphate 3-epimerase [Tetragenococcus koreensis]MDN6630278.1 ribulose-phosphate 3-epimerase [Staphylococcus equorum]MDN6730723.1 ribulose-phosphate 3-epimerase [Atopostipes suicloacalis]MCF1614769.1 ribulose-phosphate 3-epimerase [Tetragenococcus koreensis]MCF1618860.1 ribulose-phosphate 3-epimerase [Tetragenococcus koreensis]
MKILPSLMCMNLSKFNEQIEYLNNVVDGYHIDIMDGHYVRNMTLSPWFIEQLREVSEVPIDAHLMVTNPSEYVDDLLNLEVDIISFHAELLNGQAFRINQKIKKQGKNFGVVLNPESSIETIKDFIHHIDVITVMTVDPGFAGQKFIEESLTKVRFLNEYKINNNLSYEIQIDGSCNKNTYRCLAEAGADNFIVGTSGLFGLNEDINMAFEEMKSQMESEI